MLTVPGFTRVHRFSSYLSKDRPGLMSTGAVDRFRLFGPVVSRCEACLGKRCILGERRKNRIIAS